MVIFLATNIYIRFGYYWSKMVIHLVFNGFILLKITNVKQIHYITPIWFWGSLHYIVGNTIQFLFWQKMNIGMIIVGGERVFTGLGSISCSILSILQIRGWLFRIGQYQLYHPAWSRSSYFKMVPSFGRSPSSLGLRRPPYFILKNLLHMRNFK